MNRRELLLGTIATAAVFPFAVTPVVETPLLLEAVIRFQRNDTAELLSVADSFRQTKEIVAANILNRTKP